MSCHLCYWAGKWVFFRNKRPNKEIFYYRVINTKLSIKWIHVTGPSQLVKTDRRTDGHLYCIEFIVRKYGCCITFGCVYFSVFNGEWLLVNKVITTWHAYTTCMYACTYKWIMFACIWEHLQLSIFNFTLTCWNIDYFYQNRTCVIYYFHSKTVNISFNDQE